MESSHPSFTPSKLHPWPGTAPGLKSRPLAHMLFCQRCFCWRVREPRTGKNKLTHPRHSAVLCLPLPLLQSRPFISIHAKRPSSWAYALSPNLGKTLNLPPDLAQIVPMNSLVEPSQFLLNSPFIYRAAPHAKHLLEFPHTL